MKAFSLILNRCTFILAVAALVFLAYRFLAKKTPCLDQIGSWEGQTTACRVSVPRGSQFSLLLGIPADYVYSISAVTGRVVVTSAHSVLFDHSIAAEDVVSASWLSRRGLQGYIVTGHGNESSEAFAKALSQAKQVDVTVTLTPSPSTNATLWLGYLQPVFHRMLAGSRARP